MVLLRIVTACLSSAAAFGQIVSPPETLWEPVVDAVYLQEINDSIPSDLMLTDVAVVDGVAYATTGKAVYRAQGGDLESVTAPRGTVAQLAAIDDVLWAATDGGLYRHTDGTWEKVADGAFVDVTGHLGTIVAATGDTVYVMGDGELEEVGSAMGIQGIGSYSESIYVWTGTGVGFLQDGSVNYEDTQDWGTLPKGAEARGLTVIGSRLYVPTNEGVATLRGMSWTNLSGEDGLCYNDTTCVAPGFDDDFWVGTTHGLIRVVGDDFHFFEGPRWLPNNRINAVAAGDDVVYAATDGGLAVIRYEPYTLQKKAAWYKREMVDWDMFRLGFVHQLMETDDGEIVRFISDNDVGWACHYLDALCFEYAVTKDPAVRDEAIDVFKTIVWSDLVTPLPGFPARAMAAVGQNELLASTGSAGRPSEWNRTEDGNWDWKGDTSSDEVIQQLYTISIFYDLVAEGESKEAARKHMDNMLTHIIENGWALRDLDGQPTVWAQWGPEFIYRPDRRDELGLNSLQALAMVAVGEYMVGTPRYDDAKAQLLEWKYDENVLRQKKTFPGYTNFDDRLAFLAYFPLLRYETDPKLRSFVQRSLQRSWEIKRIDYQPWFDYIYAVVTGNEFDEERAVRHLREYPLDLINHRFINSHRSDLHVLPKGMTNYVTDYKPMGPREQGIRRWDRDPLDLDGGGPHSDHVMDPSSYLDCYWMGRYFGFIEAPETTDPKLLTVEPRDIRDGAGPYTGPERPEIF